MTSKYITFLKGLLLFSFILGAIATGLYFIIPKIAFSPALPFLFFFFMATSLLSYFLMLRSLNSKFSKFVNTFLLLTTVKLLLYVSVLIIYVFINRADAVGFMLNFFILYLCYTIFEVVYIIRYTGSQPKD